MINYKELSELICDECRENKDRVCLGDRSICDYYKKRVQVFYTLKKMEEQQRKLYLIGELQ